MRGRTAGFDAIVGNPPFLGGNEYRRNLGDNYAKWLCSEHSRSSQNTDLVGHFFVSTFKHLRSFGALGLIATNTIRQGDTREGSLTVILSEKGTIFRALRRLRWPGEAAVVVSVVHILKGRSKTAVTGWPFCAARVCIFS